MVSKKILILFLLLLLVFLSSCNNDNTSNDISNISTTNNKQSIEICEDKVFTEGIIREANTAKQVADIILSNSLKIDLSVYCIVYIDFEVSNAVWKVTYGIDEFTFGGDITVSLSKDTGEILSIEFGE